MLRDEVVSAVIEGKFHIWAIERVEEGIEILTGVKAGKKTAKGYEANSVFGLVDKKIKEMYAKSKPKAEVQRKYKAKSKRKPITKSPVKRKK